MIKADLAKTIVQLHFQWMNIPRPEQKPMSKRFAKNTYPQKLSHEAGTCTIAK
jgi:hypothetical protein